MQPSPEGARGGAAASELSHLRLLLVNELIRQRQLLLAPTDLLMRRPVLAVWAAAGLLALQGLAGKARWCWLSFVCPLLGSCCAVCVVQNVRCVQLPPWRSWYRSGLIVFYEPPMMEVQSKGRQFEPGRGQSVCCALRHWRSGVFALDLLLSVIYSLMAQGKRGGLITHRSLDRNQIKLLFFFSPLLLLCSCLCRHGHD
jgi:hypothetical protein